MIEASRTTPVARWVRRIRALPFRGDARHCPVCGATASRFASFGNPARQDAQCWRCHSLERHRFACEYLSGVGGLLRRGQTLLHVAPEACLEPGLRELVGTSYLTTDLEGTHVDMRMDITAIPCPDASFDGLICSHVLEHVSDDRRALAEFLRVLKPGGWALLMVPVLVETTFEDPAIVTPAQRLAAYGQEDHVRIYGQDFADRVREAGFDLTVVSPRQVLSDEQLSRLAVSADAGEIYLGRKQDAGAATGPPAARHGLETAGTGA